VLPLTCDYMQRSCHWVIIRRQLIAIFAHFLLIENMYTGWIQRSSIEYETLSNVLRIPAASKSTLSKLISVFHSTAEKAAFVFLPVFWVNSQHNL